MGAAKHGSLGTKCGSSGRSASVHILCAISPGPGIRILKVPVLEFQWLHLEARWFSASERCICRERYTIVPASSQVCVCPNNGCQRQRRALLSLILSQDRTSNICVERVKYPMGLNHSACAHTVVCGNTPVISVTFPQTGVWYPQLC